MKTQRSAKRPPLRKRRPTGSHKPPAPPAWVEAIASKPEEAIREGLRIFRLCIGIAWNSVRRSFAPHRIAGVPLFFKPKWVRFLGPAYDYEAEIIRGQGALVFTEEVGREIIERLRENEWSRAGIGGVFRGNSELGLVAFIPDPAPYQEMVEASPLLGPDGRPLVERELNPVAIVHAGAW